MHLDADWISRNPLPVDDDDTLLVDAETSPIFRETMFPSLNKKVAFSGILFITHVFGARHGGGGFTGIFGGSCTFGTSATRFLHGYPVRQKLGVLVF